MEFLISGILCGLVILLSFIIYKKKLKKHIDIIRDEIYQQEKEKIVVQVQKELDVLYDKKSQIEREISEKLSFNNSMLQLREEELNRLIEAKREEKIKLLNEQADSYYNEQLKLKKDLLISFEVLNEEEKLKAQQELQRILLELEEHRLARETINQAILREKEIQEKEDFYKILISESDRNDIKYLFSIEGNINNKQLLYKLIWSEFLIKPFNEMVNRITQGQEWKNCIYKITNLITKEIYIGKTKGEISKRWTDHIKTSLNIGTVSRTLLHTALKKYSWENFSFEVLEFGIEDLSSREKFWIEFYQSNIYGMNIKVG